MLSATFMGEVQQGRLHIGQPLADADELDGGVVLPGFRIPIASLFPA